MTTYYIDNSSAYASDANAGTSPDKPLLSLNAVNNLTLQAGDTVSFKAGTQYTGSSPWDGALQIHASGTASAPITFTSYGTGAKPVFMNTNATWSEGIELKGASYIVIDGLKVAGASEYGIDINPNSSHVTVKNSEITNVGTGVGVAGTNNLITNNYVHDLNMIVNTPTSVNNNDDYGANGFLISGSGNELSFNKVLNAKAASYDYGTDGGGFEIWGVVDQTSIHDNWVENSNGFMESGGQPGQITNMTVSGNVSLNNGTFAVLHNGGGSFGGTLSNVDVKNNTIVQSQPTSEIMSTVFLDATADRSQFYFHNNIVSLINGDSVYKQHGDYHSDNLYYLQSSATHLYNNWDNTLGPNELYGNPQFVNLAADDFHLSATSPAPADGAYPATTSGSGTAVSTDIHSQTLFSLPVSAPYTTTLLAKAGKTLIGTSGADLLDDGGRAASLSGGLGDDTYAVHAAKTTVTEGSGAGIDTVLSYLSSYILPNNVENLVLSLSTPQIGMGNALNNILVSNSAGSTLNGGDGNDILIAGRGADVLTGGSGSDIFTFNVVPTTAGHVTDFVPGVDMLDLRQLFKTAGYTGSDPLADGYLKIADNGSGGSAIYFDQDGSGPKSAALVTTLDGVAASSLQLHSDIWFA